MGTLLGLGSASRSSLLSRSCYGTWMFMGEVMVGLEERCKKWLRQSGNTSEACVNEISSGWITLLDTR
ncbi:hypothetical protein EB796_018192 [Bugula neritina]|uniref:Uncharacterized protein n=1 Tax=Bugula neritina TaxID=10212 RepID=A0A7J7JBP3_BUGNE|nr:hypothetical protein EB796_018192 [Bugula neritina]